MEEIKEFANLDFAMIFCSIFCFIIGFTAMISVIEKLADKLGIELRWKRKQKEEHDLLITTAKNLDSLFKQHEHDMETSNKNDELIRNDLEKLTDMFVDKEINDYRWEIINFASSISDGQRRNKDAYRHCLRTYEKYEEILKKYNLENGEVEISMEIINESYKEKLKNGF